MEDGHSGAAHALTGLGMRGYGIRGVVGPGTHAIACFSQLASCRWSKVLFWLVFLFLFTLQPVVMSGIGEVLHDAFHALGDYIGAVTGSFGGAARPNVIPETSESDD